MVMMYMAGYLEDSYGNKSSMRLVWAFSVIIIISTWCIISLKTMSIAAIDMGTAAAFSGLIAGKVAQAWVEEKKPKTGSNGANNANNNNGGIVTTENK